MSDTTGSPLERALPITSGHPATGVAAREDAIFTIERLRIYSGALVAGAIILPALLAIRGVWLVDSEGGGLPSDFLSFWSAGHLALLGNGAGAYDFAAHRAIEAQTVSMPFDGYFSWFYSPIFLLLSAPLALMPYVPAFLTWGTLTLLLYLAMTWAILPHRVAISLAIASPTGVMNFMDGQTGFLVAALLGGALVLLERRPILAGILFGLLTFKPQFGLLIPLVLLATGRWRVIVAAVATVGVLAAASYLAFGAEAWGAFIRSTPIASNLVLERGATGGWNKLQSLYALVRCLGGSSAVAWGAHAALAATTCVIVGWIWLRPAPYDLKAAALSAGALIVTPYVLFYDLTALAVPYAFLIRHGVACGFLRGERTLLTCLPLITLPIPWIGVTPLGGLLPLVLMGAVVAHQLGAGSGIIRATSSARFTRPTPKTS